MLSIPSIEAFLRQEVPKDLQPKCSLYVLPKPLLLPKGGVFPKVGDEVPGTLPSVGNAGGARFG